MTEGSLLLAEGVHKHYGGVRALRGVTLDVRSGEVHGLVGENGSGKSTLLRILSGQVLPDRATVKLNGGSLPFGDPTRSLASGIATVTQETTLVPDLTVAENILLGRRMVRRWRGMDWRATRARAVKALERLGLDLDPGAIVRDLSPDEQQMVEIARAISMDARILILDEPTSSLTDEEVEALFGVVRTLRSHGVSIVFVSHRIPEVLDLTDRVTVLRDGLTVATRETSELDGDQLIALMVGKELERMTAATGASPSLEEEARLRIRNLSVPGLVDDVTLDVAAGEIVGLAGLVGAGRSELLKAIFGLHPRAVGTLEVDGHRIFNADPAEAMTNGIGYVPAERGVLGLVPDMSIRENLMMARTANTLRARHPPRSREMSEVREAIDEFDVRGASNGNYPVSSLSGGNQQKVVLAKWLRTDPKVLLLDEPTRGVDVGSKAEIYKLLDDIRSEGLAVLMSASETPELLLLCDRVAVMFRGRVVTVLERRHATEARIAHYATGHS